MQNKRVRKIVVLLLIYYGIVADISNRNVNAQSSSEGVVTVSWSPDGQWIAMGGADGLLRVINATTYDVIFNANGLTGLQRSVVWSPHGDKLASVSSDKIIRIWHISGTAYPIGTLLASFEGHQDKPVSIAWSPDGSKLASVSIDETITLKIWDVEHFQVLPIAQRETTHLYKVDWSPDSQRVAVASQNGVLIFEIDTGLTMLLERLGPEMPTFAIAWSPDGSKIASGGSTKTVSIWDTNTGTLIDTYSGHTDYISALAWSYDNKRLASADQDNLIKIWDVVANTLLATYTINKSVATLTVAWSPDGTRLAYGGTGTSIEIVTTLANTIGNRIWLDANGNGIQDAGETGMPGVTVHLLNNNFGIVKTVQTNAYGFYTFADLVPGTHYYIQIIPPADTYTISPVDRGTDDTRDSDFDWRDNFGTPDPTDRVLRSMRFTASAGMQRDDLDAGFMPNSDLDVRVWRDTDGDGVQDGGEQGMAGVSLFLRRANFTRYRDPLTTDSDGFATFTNLPAGDYYVQITVPSSYSLAPFNIGPDDNIDNDFAMAFDYETGSGNVPRTLRFTLAPGVLRENIDAGLKQP